MDVCDECLTAAYDTFGELNVDVLDKETLMHICINMGSELQDHTCLAKEQPEIICNCACRGH